MKLFHKRGSPLSTVQTAAPATALPPDEDGVKKAASTLVVQEKFPPISMSAEQKNMLDQALDPRVERILTKINDSKVAAEPDSPAVPLNDPL